MSYKIVLIVSLIWQITSYTTLSMANCPAQFNITASNTTSDTTAVSLGTLLYSPFSGNQHQAKVENIVVKGDYQQLQRYRQQLKGPYIFLGIAYGIFYLTLVVLCLFDKSCPPCRSLRRNIQEEPYSNKQINVCNVTLAVCTIGILIITIIAYSSVPALKDNADMTKCSIYLTLDTAINGDSSWGGFTSLKDKIGNITSLLTAAVGEIQTYFTGDEWLITSMQTMLTDNVEFYKTYSSATLTTPNPTSTATAATAGLPTPTISSRFISQGMGPNGTANTMVTDIDAGLRTTQKLSTQAYSIVKGAKLLQASLATIMNNSQASQNTLSMYNQQLSVLVTEYDRFSKKYFTEDFPLLVVMLQSVLGVVLAGSLVVLMGVTATSCFDLLSCRNMVHLGWTLFGLGYAGVIILTYYLYSLGSISHNFCSYYRDMLTVQVSYNKLGTAYTQNAFTRLDVCLFGNGNAMEKFSIASEMNTVTKLFTDIQTYYDYTNSMSNNYINLAISTSRIAGWVTAMNSYKKGIYVDMDPAVTSNDNPNYAISQLNLYTYTGGGLATGSKDVWVWDKTNCTNSSQTTYTATAALGTTLSNTTVTCISFNEKLSTGSPSIWSFSDFTMRYVQTRTPYPDAYNKIQQYGATLIAFRDSRINLFKAIEDDLTALLVANTNFNTNMTAFGNRVTQFYGAVATLNNLITNSLDGLVKTSNCNSLADKLRLVYNVYCINFMSQITKLALCSLMLLVLMLLAVLAGCRFSMMYNSQQQLLRINMPDEMQSEKDIAALQNLQDQREDSNHSNHSNDSDR